MNILVYGAGAIGSLMVHYLCKAGNHVSLVARSTYNELCRQGLVIRHALQKKTTVDYPEIIKTADENQKYDIVFSVMQGQQQLAMLDTLCRVNTRLICLVGNNMDADKCLEYIQVHAVSKRIVLFGFWNSAGHREKECTVVGRLPVTEFVVGGLHDKSHEKAIHMIKKVFSIKGVQVKELNNMYNYYMYHVAEIMPYAYMCYKVDCDLKRLKKDDIRIIMRATKECFDYFRSIGLEVMPPGEAGFYDGGIKTLAMRILYEIMSKTVLGEFMLSDHCRNGCNEMIYIDKMFDEYRKANSGTDMPVWDNIRKYLYLYCENEEL
ncbi:MAG: ketopantoate reductase family protein [Lachnospiraceae bacterium]